ncbi:solute carrier family 2, facilitated glucose transporter member 5-like [Tiliqua scincoides]|uniref:solute carrier family 2, facilitated glucose transporter member 5-like n=1 Tax=Tiliqua scincoides TaxID=71010 RepID=UPI0034617DB3
MEETIEETEPETAVEVSKKDFTKPLVLASVISSIGGLQYGYNFWVLHFPSVVLVNFYNVTEEHKRDEGIHQSILLFLMVFAIALYPLGGLVGCLLFAPMADMCGRKQTMVINNLFSIACAILMGFSRMVESYEFSMFSRFITGLSSGIFSSIIPVYLTEIAPKNHRGAINVVASFFVIFGILLGQVFTAPQILGNEKGWPILMSFAGFVALFQMVPLLYIPESPRYLLIQKKDEGNARQVLMKLREKEDVEEEMEDLHQEDHAERVEKNMTIFKLIHFPGLQRRFIIILVLNFAQQFAGYSAAALRAYAFLLYLPVGLATFLFVFMFIPETKKKTFREIQKLVSARKTKKMWPQSMVETRQEIAKPGPKKEIVQDFYNISFGDVPSLSEDKNYNRFLTGITIALFPLGGTLGSFVVGPLTDDHGRKGALLVNSVFSMISAILVACSTVVEGYEFTMISRFASGVCSGIFYTAVPIYLSELSPTNLRGSLTLMPHFFLVFGVMIAQILALREILGTQEGWPILMSLVAILAFCQIIIMPTFPESPRYLLIQKGNEEKAREALKKLRNQEDVENEIKGLHQEDLAEKDEKNMNMLKLLSCPNLRRQVFNAISLACSQELVGINAAYHYTERIYIATNVGLDNVRFMTIISSTTILIILFIMLYIINFVERKTLLLVGLAVCGLCCVLLFVTLQYQDTVLWMSYAGTIVVNLYIIGHAIGPSTIPNVLTAEMFLQSSRSSAYVIQGFMHWLISFIIGVTYLNIEAKLKSHIFLLFIPFNIAAFIYSLKFLPETNNKTFLEIRMATQRTQVRRPTAT